MNTATKLFTIALSFVLSFGIYFSGNTSTIVPSKNNISTFTDGHRKERVCIDGVWYIITYDSNGGIVEITIDSND